jgi:two-component sensor histidine kinase
MVMRPLGDWRLEPWSTEAYAFAIACVAVATVLRWGLGLVTDDILPFPTYYPAVLFAALVGGTYAGVVAALLGGVIGWFAFVTPYFAFLPISVGQAISLALYLIASLTIVWGANHYVALTNRLKAEEEFRKLAVEELAHRLKNKVATIQAIIGTRLRDHPQARDTVLKMLAALSRTDDLIIASQGHGAQLTQILLAELGPYDSSRVTMKGPNVLFPPKLAVTMALVVHELATNAAKYGAFSNSIGTLKIEWSISSGQLTMRWEESGGPPTTVPSHQGFGSRLLPRALLPFDGTIERQFATNGLSCEIRLKVYEIDDIAESKESTPQEIEGTAPG